MARFEIGQTYKFIDVSFERTTPIWSALYHPGIDTLNAITVLELTCKEEHNVCWDYDEEGAEPKYKGYVFEDAQGRKWNNQYPRASYGQTSDAGDRLVYLSCDGQEKEDIEYTVKNDLIWKATLMSEVIETSLRAKLQNKYPEEYMYKMEQYCEVLLRLFGKTEEEYISGLTKINRYYVTGNKEQA